MTATSYAGEGGLPGYLTLDCRDGSHRACAICDCPCHLERRRHAMSATKAWAELARQITGVLSQVPECPDSQEPGRACRYCEAEAVAAWVFRRQTGVPL